MTALALRACGAAFLLAVVATSPADAKQKRAEGPDFHDAHVHLTNYVQEGTTPRAFLKVMGGRVGRATLFGIPLQQQWSHRVSGDFAPTYYLETDAPLYYYSFTDAFIAHAYLQLTAAERARFDPMITGFNPTDMYAVDHIRRVLQLYPGVFSGIGEFTIHKEFVSSKIAGEVASLTDPALDRVLAFAGEAGLLVLLHSDVTTPFAEPDTPRIYLEQLKALFRRHPETTIVWAHLGLGRVIEPVTRHAAMLETMLRDPAYAHVSFDLSWDETAKYLVASPEAVKVSAQLIARYPDRFLFGTDTVASTDVGEYLETFEMYRPLWQALGPEASAKVRLGNYERLFDEARRRVRAWEKANVPAAR